MSTAKRILITGTSTGFGFDSVKALAERGHTVYATMRGVRGKNAASAEALTSWAKAGGHAVTVIELDVSDETSVDNAVALAVEQGGIDVLVHNAGTGSWGIDEGYSVEQAQQVFNVNLFGVMRLNRAVVPHMRHAGRGLLIYVSSAAGRLVFPFMSIYTATKFALEAYAESIQFELAPLGIDSVIIQPGAYGTNFLANISPPQHDVSSAYGQTAEQFAAISSDFRARVESGDIGDRSEVASGLIEEIERPAGPRPLRRVIGADVSETVGAINQTCAQIQDQLLIAFGLK
ncbi:MAG: SDR family oxidoreductase [Haliangiales bacterium]